MIINKNNKNNNNNKKISAIIFDMDGVLVDLVEVHYISLNQALKKVSNYEISNEEHIKYYNGISTKAKLEMLINRGLVDKKDYQKIWDLKQENTFKVIDGLKEDTQKINMLKSLKEKYGYSLVCCSNSIRETVSRVLTKTGLLNYLDFYLGNEDFGKRIKPDPYPYELACSKLNIKVSEAVVVEDSPKGLQSAYSSGANVLKVKDPSEVTLKNIELFIKDL
jgi:beta-phosphoglucomutase-like phosphatase (HAD superfamily)